MESDPEYEPGIPPPRWSGRLRRGTSQVTNGPIRGPGEVTYISTLFTHPMYMFRSRSPQKSIIRYGLYKVLRLADAVLENHLLSEVIPNERVFSYEFIAGK